MSLADAITSLENTFVASGLLEPYKGYETFPFNFTSTISRDPISQLPIYSEKIGLRAAAFTQNYGYPDINYQTFYLGRVFLVQNQKLQDASILVASGLGGEILRLINNWGINCAPSVDRLSDLRATPQVKQDEKIAQALRAIASPNSPEIQTSYWYAEVIVSFNMKYYL